MVIGIDASRATAGQRTGTEAYAFFLIRALIPLTAEAGLTLRLYYNLEPAADLFPEADHVQWKAIPLPRLWTHIRLGLELRRRPPDVFFTPAHVIPAGYRKPAVATVHDLGFIHFPEAHTQRQVAYLNWSTRHNVRRSKPLITDSMATREDLIRIWGVDPMKIKVIHPGIDPSLGPVTDRDRLEDVQRSYGINGPYLLFIGTLQPRKNLARLIEAYAASGLTHQLILAGGSGWRSQSIMARISEQKAEIRQRIVLPGFVKDEDKATLISGATALVYPSLYEGFGFPLIEANACGTPVLAANSSSLPEIAGEAALLVDPLDTDALSDGLRHIATDEALRARLVTAGLANKKRFTWEKAAGQVLEVLKEAAQS